MLKFLIIQTAFTGDVVLATAIAEKLHDSYPDARIDFLLRKGNEGLLKDHPFIKNVLIWDKKTNKNKNLLLIAKQVRNEKYTHIINPHRFATSGIITLLSGAKHRIGFSKNPLSVCYTQRVDHLIDQATAAKPTTDSRID
jgi:ADP-heptose:LPS heptosyltransferase